MLCCNDVSAAFTLSGSTCLIRIEFERVLRLTKSEMSFDRLHLLLDNLTIGNISLLLLHSDPGRGEMLLSKS